MFLSSISSLCSSLFSFRLSLIAFIISKYLHFCMKVVCLESVVIFFCCLFARSVYIIMTLDFYSVSSINSVSVHSFSEWLQWNCCLPTIWANEGKKWQLTKWSHTVRRCHMRWGHNKNWCKLHMLLNHTQARKRETIGDKSDNNNKNSQKAIKTYTWLLYLFMYVVLHRDTLFFLSPRINHSSLWHRKYTYVRM